MSFDVNVRREVAGRRIGLEFASNAIITALVGPSGSGKSTILNMIAGLIRPHAGRVIVRGDILFDSDAAIDLPPERRCCGYVFQDLRLFPHMNVRDNLLYGRRRSVNSSIIEYASVIDLLDLRGLETRRPATLSGGEARRVAIGRTLLSNPSFLLLDEPLTSLDQERRHEAMAILERLRDRLGLPILYVTHQTDEILRIAGQVVEMA